MKQVARLLSRKEPSCNSDHGETEEIQYPFTLRTVQKDGLACSTCPWYRMCRGCTIDCNGNLQNLSAPYIAIDWDPKEMHLQYQMSQERMIEDHSSIEQNRKQDIEPINLDQCFEAFTKEEELGEEESWYCSRCKKHQTATKKMNIWKLPPVLIIHLKRFQFVNNRWAKSAKVVRFPVHDFDPSKYVFVPPTSVVTTKGSATSAQSTEVMQSPSLQRDYPPALAEDRTRPQQASLADKEEKACIGSEKQGEEGNTSLSRTKVGETEEVLKSWVVVDEVKEDVTSSLQPPGRAVRVSTESSVDQMVVGNDKCDEEDQLFEHINDNTVVSRIGHQYELYAISSHTGILGGGHYITYAKNPNGKWYIYNDSSCKETVEQRVSNESPYLLFYQRQDFTFYYKPERTERVDVSHDDDDYNADARRFCVIQ
jgi:ubiquitin carboxyl-terminal hydrolase 6/32